MKQIPRSKVRWLRRVLCAFVAFAVTTAIAAAGEAVNWRDPPQGVFDDHWMVVMINGQRSGYSHMTIKRVGDVIESRSVMEMTIQRGVVRIKMTRRTLERETLEGEPLDFDVEQNMSLMGVRKKGVIRDGRVYITTTQQGQTTKADYPWDPKAKMSWSADRATRAKPVGIGRTYEIWCYDPLTKPSGPIRTVGKVVAKETIDVLGRQVEAFKLETTTYLGVLPVTGVSYVDRNEEMLKTTVDLSFVKAEIIACDEAFARKKGGSPDLFLQTFVELPKPLDARRLKRIRYRLRVADEIPEELFPKTTMQTATRRSPHEVILDVRRIDWSKLGKGTSQSATIPDAVKPYLASSSFLNARDPEIVKLARQAVGKEKNPVKQADKLRKFVTEYVEEKDLSVGLATASEVARSRKGDCTEHAVLLAAMARAAGLPARCVGGMGYVSFFAGRRNVFAFHMWTQVWIAGQWIDVDAAFRQTECDPSHIAMTILALNEDSMIDFAVGLLPFIGKTRIEVLETSSPGK